MAANGKVPGGTYGHSWILRACIVHHTLLLASMSCWQRIWNASCSRKARTVSKPCGRAERRDKNWHAPPCQRDQMAVTHTQKGHRTYKVHTSGRGPTRGSRLEQHYQSMGRMASALVCCRMGQGVSTTKATGHGGSCFAQADMAARLQGLAEVADYGAE